MTNSESKNITIGEASSQYLATLPDGQRTQSLQELSKFVRWYARERPFSGLTADEVGNYAERLARTDSDAAQKLDTVKAFLVAAKKEGWTKANLSLSIKIKRTKSRTLGPNRKTGLEPVPLTQAKYDELTVELANMRTRRIEVIGDVTRAAADKDFRENAPFHAAREQKSMIEGKILEIEETLETAVIVEKHQEKSRTVCVGDTLVLEQPGNSQRMQYTLVHPKEVEPSKGKISVTSPVGKAVLGRLEGETVEVTVPSGKRYYCIKQIIR
jgi:transcription elongation factor GreA